MTKQDNVIEPASPDAAAMVGTEAWCIEHDGVDDWTTAEGAEYRYCADPFCACTDEKLLFLVSAGILDGDGTFSRHGERLRYLWRTDPARIRSTYWTYL